MPLPIAHGLLGASIVAATHRDPISSRQLTPFLLGAVLANTADFDFILMFLFDSKAWHRGFSHSLVFALVVCVSLALSSGKKRFREAVAYGLAFASHGLLDYATTLKGGGVALLWPFSVDRLVLGWWGLSEMPSKMTQLQILKTLGVELMVFAPLLMAVMLTRLALDKNRESTAGTRCADLKRITPDSLKRLESDEPPSHIS